MDQVIAQRQGTGARMRQIAINQMAAVSGFISATVGVTARVAPSRIRPRKNGPVLRASRALDMLKTGTRGEPMAGEESVQLA
jgi:hypothetical protein